MNKIKLVFGLFILTYYNNLFGQVIILNNYELDSITITSPKYEFNSKEFKKIKKRN